MLRVVVYVALLSCLHFIAQAELSACLQKYKASEFTANIPVFPRAALRHGFSAGGTLHTEKGHHVYERQLSLPEVVLERATSSWGDTGRLRKLFHKLHKGQAVNVLVLGGSITCGGETLNIQEGWSYLVYKWIQATWPMANHTYSNHCKPATPSMVVAACLDSYYIPENIDLILFEFTVNDHNPLDMGNDRTLPIMENEWRRGFERLVRKLTKIKSWPALMYIHMYQPFRMKSSFWASAETEMEQILQYYSVPTVSARNALYHLHMNKAHGFAEEDVHCGVHPNPLGHRYYGDLVIGALQDHAFAAYTLVEEHMQFPRDFASLTGVPPPMLKDNWDYDSECLTGELLRQAMVPELTTTAEWSFVDEAHSARQKKLGFRTTLPDTSIVLEVNTLSRGNIVKGDILLALGYLTSYEHMGAFSVACVSGCTCEGLRNVSATLDWHASIYKFIYFSASQSTHCRLNITSLRSTMSGEHKVKFDMLMVASGIPARWVDTMNMVFQLR